MVKSHLRAPYFYKSAYLLACLFLDDAIILLELFSAARVDQWALLLCIKGSPSSQSIARAQCLRSRRGRGCNTIYFRHLTTFTCVDGMTCPACLARNSQSESCKLQTQQPLVARQSHIIDVVFMYINQHFEVNGSFDLSAVLTFCYSML
jgi:hypothetical protein